MSGNPDIVQKGVQDRLARLERQLTQANSHQEILAVMFDYMRPLEFPRFIIFFQLFESFDHPPIVCYTTLPPEWYGRYVLNSYYNVDPVIQHVIKKNHQVLFWSVEDDWLPHGPQALELLADLKTWGFRQGVFLPFSFQQARGGVNLLCDKDPPSIRVAEVALVLPYFLAHMLRMYAETTSQTLLRTKLTQRESQIYELVADGLTSQEIGDRLQMSKRTVDTHITAVQEKLGAQNRIQALCRAVSLGLISPTGSYRSTEQIQFVFSEQEGMDRRC